MVYINSCQVTLKRPYHVMHNGMDGCKLINLRSGPFGIDLRVQWGGPFERAGDKVNQQADIHFLT